MNEPISICLICSNRLLREGFARLLDSPSTYVVGTVPNINALDSARPDQDEPFYVYISTAPRNPGLPFDTLARFRIDHPQRKLIVLVPEIDGAGLGRLHEIGVEGCLSLDLSPRTILAYLKLIQAGERIYSENVLREPGRKSGKLEPLSLSQDNKKATSSLSTGEIDLLKELVDGGTNRQIARNLGLHEDAVKLNLKKLMKRIDASNRTQAAVWAVKRGIVKAGSS